MTDADPHKQEQKQSLGDMIGDVTRDFSTLVRQEVELAKAELRESATRGGKGAGMFGGAAVAGYLTLLFLSIALWWGLGELIGNGWSALVVAVLWGIIAAILAVIGKKEFKSIKGMPRTASSVKKIPETLKPNGDHS
ncbi:phage holin family protein [Salinibacterium sp. SYSU T00001]|uniref:phage holin family protein n=1 Tax=Homoserinimonas sedimenticola TaxID=2986805 RepID=UPI002235982B|nr:phage holin family protein [Salinibacterium sedimenticola]MCW4385762.1 phage holin family protein [Salinibacterium sedimenticola]